MEKSMDDSKKLSSIHKRQSPIDEKKGNTINQLMQNIRTFTWEESSEDVFFSYKDRIETIGDFISTQLYTLVKNDSPITFEKIFETSYTKNTVPENISQYADFLLIVDQDGIIDYCKVEEKRTSYIDEVLHTEEQHGKYLYDKNGRYLGEMIKGTVPQKKKIIKILPWNLTVALQKKFGNNYEIADMTSIKVGDTVVLDDWYADKNVTNQRYKDQEFTVSEILANGQLKIHIKNHFNEMDKENTMLVVSKKNVSKRRSTQ